MDQQDNIIFLEPPRLDTEKSEDRVVEAVMRLKNEPIKQVNWPVVMAWLIVGQASMVCGVFIPSNAGVGVKLLGALAFLVSILCVGAAILYRDAPRFWVVRKLGSRRWKRNRV
jgi:hypothetical protein